MKTIFIYKQVKKTIIALKYIFFIAFIFCSCSKPDDSPTPISPPAVIVNPTPIPTTELILAAGMAIPLDGSANLERAAIWRNGVISYLTPINVNSLAKGFDVLNTATVVCGTTGFGISGANVTKATLWFNNDMKILEINPTEYSEANAVQVSTSNSVNIVGCSTLKNQSNITYAAATLWQGTSVISKTLLTTQAEIDNGNSSVAYGVDTVGSDVYVAGLYKKGGSVTQAVYWKNGLKKEITTEFGSNSCANAIEVTNGKVYATGYITVANRKLATLWIFNDESSLAPQEITLEAVLYNNSESVGLKIFNTGSITYVYGINSGAAIKPNCFGRQWKYENNVLVNKYFGQEEPETTLCSINYGHMFTNVSGSGALSNYAVGSVELDFQNSSIITPCYWKNNGNRTNIETTPVSNGQLIGVRVL